MPPLWCIGSAPRLCNTRRNCKPPATRAVQLQASNLGAAVKLATRGASSCEVNRGRDWRRARQLLGRPLTCTATRYRLSVYASLSALASAAASPRPNASPPSPPAAVMLIHDRSQNSAHLRHARSQFTAPRLSTWVCVTGIMAHHRWCGPTARAGGTLAALPRNSKLAHQRMQRTQAGLLIWGPGGAPATRPSISSRKLAAAGLLWR